MNRRHFTLMASAALIAPASLHAATGEIWSATDAADALAAGKIAMIDVRSRAEWAETGVATGAWPISLHEPKFETRLLAAREMAAGKPVALICATGGRSGRVFQALKQAGFQDFIDVSEGMLGSRRGPGWLALDLPVTDLQSALLNLPEALQ